MNFILALSLVLGSPIAFAQDLPGIQAPAPIEMEQNLIQEERRILNEILNSGQMDEAFLKSYPRVLRESYPDNPAIEARVNVLGKAIEASLILGAQDEIMTEDEIKGFSPDEANRAVENRV
jgi:hypothetical protein